MSLRWKYVIVVNAAIVATTALLMLTSDLGADVHALVRATLMLLVLSFTLLYAYRCFVAVPLRKILEGAEKLAEGDRTHRIELEGDDELGSIAHSINTMAERVAKVHDRLEAKVHERTDDLRAVLQEVHERSRIIEEVNLRLAESDRRKTDFLTSVSHDIRTPLNSILGYLRLLLEGLYEDEDEMREFLGNARLSASHLLHLVNDVLSGARLAAGTLELNLRAVNLATVVGEVLGILEVSIRDQGIDVQVEIDDESIVLADEPKLRQVLVNLVGNAVKYTDEGGIVIRARHDGEWVRIEVEDTGVGIPVPDLDRIFQKFHQVDTGATRAKGGTGLGLAITRELLELMGGAISAHSEGPGTGSTFRLSLPVVVDVPAPV